MGLVYFFWKAESRHVARLFSCGGSFFRCFVYFFISTFSLVFHFAALGAAFSRWQAHKTYNIVERFRSKLELAEDGVFSEDVSLPTVAALLVKLVGQGDDLVSSTTGRGLRDTIVYYLRAKLCKLKRATHRVLLV